MYYIITHTTSKVVGHHTVCVYKKVMGCCQRKRKMIGFLNINIGIPTLQT